LDDLSVLHLHASVTSDEQDTPLGGLPELLGHASPRAAGPRCDPPCRRGRRAASSPSGLAPTSGRGRSKTPGVVAAADPPCSARTRRRSPPDRRAAAALGPRRPPAGE